MREIFFRKTILLIFTLLVFVLSFSCASANYEIINESNSVDIKTEVSAEANTGNNESSNSEIKTGDASAESQVKVEVSSSDSGEEENDNKIKIEAKAEANGEKVEAEVNAAGGENINIKKEISDEGSQANLEVEVTHGTQGQSDAEPNLLNTEEKEDINKKDSKIKNVFVSIGNTTKSIFANIADKIKSLFL